jgi:5-methylthioadenosine/S-adenosylhomocysteine deaminase
LLLDPDAPGGASGPFDIVIEGDTISSIVPASSAIPRPLDAEVVDAAGLLAMPGLVNAHVHSSGMFERGSLENLPLELFMLWEVPPVGIPAPPIELYQARVLLGAVEMLKAGTTSVFDDVILPAGASEESIDAVMGAWRDCGIRATVGLYQPNRPPIEWLPWLPELLPPDARAPFSVGRDADDILTMYERFVQRWHGAADGRIRCAASCSAPQRSTDDYLVRLHDFASDHDLRFVMHIYESKAQRVTGELLFGGSLIRHVQRLGVLDERSVVIHAVWVDDDDIGDLAASGATVVHSPAGNLRCGSGLMPFRALARAGVPIALCTDEATVEDTSSMWSSARLAAQVHTLAGPAYEEWPVAREVLDAMTVHGARATGLSGTVGVLREGAQADLLLLDLSTSTYVPNVDLVQHLVHGEEGRSIRLVMVDGRVVVRDGVVLTLDEDRVLSEARDLAAGYTEASRPVNAWAEHLRPAFDEVYRRAAATGVGFTRWLAP